MSSKSRGYDAQVEFEREKAVRYARIVLGLQLGGDQYAEELARLLGLTLNTVAFALHELQVAGVVGVAARNVRSSTKNRISLWTALYPAHQGPAGLKDPTASGGATDPPKRRRVCTHPGDRVGITDADLAYQAYWSLPRELRKYLQPPPGMTSE